MEESARAKAERPQSLAGWGKGRRRAERPGSWTGRPGRAGPRNGGSAGRLGGGSRELPASGEVKTALTRVLAARINGVVHFVLGILPQKQK